MKSVYVGYIWYMLRMLSPINFTKWNEYEFEYIISTRNIFELITKIKSIHYVFQLKEKQKLVQSLC